jgi:hypothetical protein
MLEVKIAEYIVADAFVAFEPQLAGQIEPAPLQITDNTSTT